MLDTAPCASIRFRMPISIKSLVGQDDSAWIEAIEQLHRSQPIMRLARCQAEPDGEPLRINERVEIEIRGKPFPATIQRKPLYQPTT